MTNRQPTGRGIVSVTRGPVDLVAPPDVPDGHVRRYGLAIAFQIAARKVALYCNVRRLGVPCIDFEAGSDVVLFDDLSRISAGGAVTITRNHDEAHPRSGRPLIMVKHTLIGGFVPLGAKRPDGSDHPHAGSGFAIGPAVGYAADFSERLAGENQQSHRYLELVQLSCDGKSFRAGEPEHICFENLLPSWRIINRGLGLAIPDGDDLLFGLVAHQPGEEACSGLSRWQYGRQGWRPASFTPVTPKDTSMEPNVHRDLDGSLVFGARCSSHEKGDGVTFGIRVWRSEDGGRTWRQIIEARKTRASTPVVLNQAADGTPYVTANPYCEAVIDDAGRKVGVWSHRQKLHLWPLNDDRTALLEPILVRDTADFGPPPPGRLWHADHPIATTVQLADGAWHNVLGYRVRISQPTREDSEFPTPFTGSYVEQVVSSGPPRPMWTF